MSDFDQRKYDDAKHASDYVTVYADSDGDIFVTCYEPFEIACVELSIEDARRMAHGLLAAARHAEVVQGLRV